MQCRLNAWTCWGPGLIYECCVQHVFLCLNTDFVGSINTINICLILSTISSFIPVSNCVGRGSNALICPEPYNAVKMALVSWVHKNSYWLILKTAFVFFIKVSESEYEFIQHKKLSEKNTRVKVKLSQYDKV